MKSATKADIKDDTKLCNLFLMELHGLFPAGWKLRAVSLMCFGEHDWIESNCFDGGDLSVPRQAINLAGGEILLIP